MIKMLKKVILTVVAVLIAGGALMLYGTYKVANVAIDEALKEHEPQLRQYMQMSEAEQNQYVLDNAAVLMKDIIADAKPEEKADMELIEKTKDDPVVQKALVELGRSVTAKAILRLDTLTADMSAEVKAKYQKESDEFKSKLEAYGQAVKAAEKNLNAQ